MKQIIVWLTLLLTPTLALFAGKPGSTARQATVTVSCSVCPSGESLTIAGSGFGRRSVVTVTLNGPHYGVQFVETDHRGRFSLDYPTGLNAPGEYTVTGSQGTTFASSSFEVE